MSSAGEIAVSLPGWPQVSQSEFITANTYLMAPPLAPEIALHLAEESLPIWSKTEDELAALGLADPFWAFAWSGGQALARYILDHPATVAGRRVVDLGLGSGLAAIAAKRAGAQHVLAADTDPIAASAIDINAKANGVDIEVVCADLIAADAPLTTDVLLLGDVFYDAALAALLIDFASSVASSGAVVLAGDPQRAYFPLHRFEGLARYSVPVTRELEDAEIKSSLVWRLVQGSH